jgi:hypothetical protein
VLFLALKLGSFCEKRAKNKDNFGTKKKIFAKKKFPFLSQGIRTGGFPLRKREKALLPLFSVRKTRKIA